MGYDSYPSFKNEPFYDLCLRYWPEVAACGRAEVIAEFYDAADGVLYVAEKCDGAVSAFVLVDKGEHVDEGVVWRGVKHISEAECPVYANPPAWFLALLKGPEPKGGIDLGGPSWREMAAANVEWRGVVLQRIREAGPGSVVEFRDSDGLWLADVGAEGELIPRDGKFWPGLAAVVHGVANGGTFVVRRPAP